MDDRHAKLRNFLKALYYNSSAVFTIKLCFLRQAFMKVCTGKVIFEIGTGGDGKGMEAILERTPLGEENSSTLDCGCFTDRGEFRKSGEFAWNRPDVQVQEMDHAIRFIGDVWKRFVVDEEIDCRVNYGFTVKRKVGDSMKVQELSCENVPVVEESLQRQKSATS